VEERLIVQVVLEDNIPAEADILDSTQVDLVEVDHSLVFVDLPIEPEDNFEEVVDTEPAVVVVVAGTAVAAEHTVGVVVAHPVAQELQLANTTVVLDSLAVDNLVVVGRIVVAGRAEVGHNQLVDRVDHSQEAADTVMLPATLELVAVAVAAALLSAVLVERVVEVAVVVVGRLGFAVVVEPLAVLS
jgi:hypothetical protein